MSGGEFVGGADVALELAESGELQVQTLTQTQRHRGAGAQACRGTAMPTQYENSVCVCV